MKYLASPIYICAASLMLSACATHPTFNLAEYPYTGSTTTTVHNGVSTSIPIPHIETANKVVKIDVRERVTGYGCSSELKEDHAHVLPFLGVGTGFDLETNEGKARAVAHFNALFVKQGDSGKTEKVIDDSVNNDLLIAPTYQIRRIKRGAFSEEVCARVIGYRGVVAGFEDSKHIRSTDPKYRGSPDVYLDQIEGGKAKLLIF